MKENKEQLISNICMKLRDTGCFTCTKSENWSSIQEIALTYEASYIIKSI